jgi:L-iditol 2-dehydrogenase/galactitol-1-phosphate 5-dehydrogenase
MTATMKALAVTAARTMDLVPLDRPVPGPGEALIRVAYCGICGSDFPRYFDGAVHSFPQTLGHEFSGTVEAVGPGVGTASAGDRVCVAPLVPCGECPSCRAGAPALCNRYSFVGSRQQGALAEYVIVPVQNLVHLPQSVSLRDAALIEPLTIALHGIGRVNLSPGARVAVFGAGVIGLLTVMALKALGADHVTAIDIQEDKLALARELGADETVLALGTGIADHFATAEVPELCLETAGHPSTQVAAIQHCAKGGSVVFIGTSTRTVSFEPEVFEKILRGELTITGSWMSYSAPFPGAEWTTAVRLLAEGAVAVEPLVSRVYSLEDGAQAFEDIRGAGGQLLKVLYAPGGAK